MLVCCPSQSGKSELVLNLLQNIDTMIQPRPQKINYYFSEYQTAFERHPEINFCHGLPSPTELEQMQDTILVVDDSMQQIDENILNVFTRGSHHRNISIILILQNLFHKNRFLRTISLNAQYIILMRNVRDATQIQQLARQIYPQDAKFLIDAYIKSTRRPYGYLVIDLKTDQDDSLRVRTKVFPVDRQVVYVSKKTWVDAHCIIYLYWKK